MSHKKKMSLSRSTKQNRGFGVVMTAFSLVQTSRISVLQKSPEEWRTFYVSASLWRIDFDKRVAEQAVMSNGGCPGGFGEH